MRAVFDTNAIVSGSIVIHGIPFRRLQAARSPRFTLITSAVLVAEVVRVLSRDRVRRRYRLEPGDIALIREFLESDATLVPLTVEVQGVATHPEDDLILSTALSGQADYLVTGDRQLLNLGTSHGVTILSPRAFWERLEAK